MQRTLNKNMEQCLITHIILQLILLKYFTQGAPCHMKKQGHPSTLLFTSPIHQVRYPQNKRFILKYRVSSLQPIYINEKRTIFAKAYGIKVMCYWDFFLGNVLGTWELFALRTPKPQPGKKNSPTHKKNKVSQTCWPYQQIKCCTFAFYVCTKIHILLCDLLVFICVCAHICL